MRFVIKVAKLAAGQVDDLERKVVSNAMDMVRQLLRVRVHFVLWFRLWYVSAYYWADV